MRRGGGGGGGRWAIKAMSKVRKGRERACKNIFNHPLQHTFGLMRCRKVKMSTCQSTPTVRFGSSRSFDMEPTEC